ncbi:MAG: tyrosine-type recombinase/integrase [Candidatus Dormibacteria bacterium]
MSRRGPTEGSVYRRASDGRWVGSIRTGGGERSSVYASTQAEAIARLRALHGQLGAGLPVVDPRATVGKFLTAWLESVEPRLRPSTFARYSGLVRGQLVPRLGSIRLAKLQPGDVGRMMAQVQQDGLSARTAAHCRAVLRAALADGEKWGQLGRNVARLADAPRVPAPEPVVLSAAAAHAVIAAMGDGQMARLVTVALFTGLRLGEELALRWGDVDLDAGVLTVRRSLLRLGGAFTVGEPKSATSRRVVALPPQAVAALSEERAAQAEVRLAAGKSWRPGFGELVFSGPAGEPLVGPTVSQRFQRHLRTAGLPHLRFHDLRAAHGALLLASGTDISVVSRRLGHSSVALTSRHYGGVAEALQRDAADRLGRLLQQPV